MSYLMQKLARAFVGTNNIGQLLRYAGARHYGLFRTVGYGGIRPIHDIENASLVLSRWQQHGGGAIPCSPRA